MEDAAALIEASGSRFSNLELIGRGSFGDVYKGFDNDLKKEVAIKVIDLEESEDDTEQGLDEAEQGPDKEEEARKPMLVYRRRQREPTSVGEGAVERAVES